MKKITLIALFACSPLLAQTNCSTAIPVTLGTHTVAAITGTQAITVSCSSTGSATLSEWYTFTPTESSNYIISTDLEINAGKDTRFHIYSGTCNGLNCIGGDDDSGNGYLSISETYLQANNTYYIVFDNRWQATGFDFSITQSNNSYSEYVNFSQVSLLNNQGYQLGAFDINNDGLDDIVQIGTNTVQVRPQIQGDNSFSSYTNHTVDISHLPSWSMAAGDLNGDGLSDLVLGGGQGATIVLSNGNSYTSYNPSNYIFSQRTNMIDLNNDGELDVFVCHDVAPNTYFLNGGNNTFTFHQGGIGDHPNGGNYGSIWVDYDNDQLPDLFIAKCRGGASTAKLNQLFKNNGDGTFTEVSVEANMNHPNQTWSSAWGDFDNDGYMDAFIGVSSTSDGGHLLMHNNGDGTFTDIFTATGLYSNFNMNNEFVAADMNNDGWIDIVTGANGIFYNNGDGTFSPNITQVSAGALADLNNDGFLDIYNGGKIYYNLGNENNWLKIKLIGTNSNYNGIGARIEIYADNEESSWQKQIRDVRSGEGFRYMGSLNAHFGLGQETSIDRIVIHWPSGLSETMYNPTINSLLTLTEGTLLSNNEIVTESFRIYPNPTTDVLNIDLKDHSTADQFSYEIYSIEGKKVLFGTSNKTIDVHNLDSGTYIIKISTNTHNQNIKFLKK